MLKRRTGLFLITALVITGLAGTSKNNSLTKAERKYAAELMKETYKELLNSTKGLSKSQLDYKPSAQSGSIREIVQHILLTEKEHWKMLETVMKLPANPEKRREIQYTDEEIVKKVLDQSIKYNTEFKYKNISYKTLHEALADFKSSSNAHIKYIKTSTEDFRNHLVQIPEGWIDAYQFCQFITINSKRYIQLINEIKADAGFPKK